MAKITLGGLDVALEHIEDRGLLVLYCSVGLLPAEVSPDVYEFLLEANLFGVGLAGGHLDLHRPSRAMLFSLSLHEDDLSAPRLANALERFTEQVAGLINTISEHLSPAPVNADPAPLLGIMLRV